MKKTPKLDLNSFDFEGSNHDKLFLANYHELRKTYEELFYEELKESAEKAWLSGDDWKIFVKHALSWDDYTDFFKKLADEYSRRKEAGYYDLGDLANPYIWNLQFQITPDIIKKERIRTYLVEHFYGPNYSPLFNDLIRDYHQLKEIYEHDLKSEYLMKKIPYDTFVSSIKIVLSEEEIKELYAKIVCRKQESKPGISSYFPLWVYEESIEFWVNTKLLFLLQKALKDEQQLTDLLMTHEEELIVYLKIGKGYPIQELPARKDFDEWFLAFHDKYKFALEENEVFRRFYTAYLIRKLRLFNRLDLLQEKDLKFITFMSFSTLPSEKHIEKYSREYWEKREKENREVIYWYHTLEQLIEFLPPTSEEYQLLSMLKMIFFEIWDREEPWAYFSEIAHRAKRLTDKKGLWEDAIKEYFYSILNYPFRYSEDKERWISELSNEIDDFFGEGYTKKLKETFFPNKYRSKSSDVQTRSQYKIWLIFDKQSKKAFDLYCNDPRNEKFFKEMNISPRQFTILAEEFRQQQRLDIDNKLKNWTIHFVLIFEMDHETRLAKIVWKNEYLKYIKVCKKNKQHFSKDSFETMLKTGIFDYEASLKKDN